MARMLCNSPGQKKFWVNLTLVAWSILADGAGTAVVADAFPAVSQQFRREVRRVAFLLLRSCSQACLASIVFVASMVTEMQIRYQKELLSICLSLVRNNNGLC